MCNKKKFTKVEAMMRIANAEVEYKKRKGRSKRRECRYYWCNECKAFHLTSQEYNMNNRDIRKGGDLFDR